MLEKIEFSDIEKSLVDFLVVQMSASSDTAQVVTRIPDVRPKRMVRVSRNDRKARIDVEDREGRRGSQLILDRPRVVFECTDDAGNAAGLAALVRAIVNAAAPGYIGTVWCDHVEDAGEENDTDPVTAAPRYTIVTDLIVRGKVLA
ncbi:hypothetical protein [Nocardia huaxiensis]|uniref:Tail terminator n=1 Tax=Nocardia huaxiensis TaxID=2755382 RepID=A0A7D6VIJ3_9NOCA|nr:hypothetical protein [Nocardia huaxiensis]QLY30836.1 hypothetical protein H0264_38140 [Nocardia huaxiensis]UFS94340.1 hypothetical protein LPY97_26725 [Nocardia huaxiensis]